MGWKKRLEIRAKNSEKQTKAAVNREKIEKKIQKKRQKSNKKRAKKRQKVRRKMLQQYG